MATKRPWIVRCKRAIATIVVFGLIVLPQAIFVTRATGSMRLEGKSAQILAMDKRILTAEGSSGSENRLSDTLQDAPSSLPNVTSSEPWEQKWALDAIDKHLDATGVVMRPQAEVVRETRVTLGDLLRVVKRGIRTNLPALLGELTSRWLGAPLLPGLALLGAIRRPWRGAKALSRLFVAVISIAPAAATVVCLYSEGNGLPVRYYFIFVPLLIIWAANGLVEVGSWIRASSAFAGWSFVARPVVSLGILPTMVGFLMVVSAAGPVRGLYVFAEGSQSNRAEKEVGLWIGHQQDRQVRIMGGIPMAFHAGARWVPFPYCSADLALQYLDAAQVDYIVLQQGEKFTKYYEDWLEHGIPDRRAELVHVPLVNENGGYVVYRWHRIGFERLTGFSTRHDERLGLVAAKEQRNRLGIGQK
jgi:hypothetical protein